MTTDHEIIVLRRALDAADKRRAILETNAYLADEEIDWLRERSTNNPKDEIMIWKRTRFSRWTSGDFCITEIETIDGRPYQLYSLDSESLEFFHSLKEAQAAAQLRNEASVLRRENASLREQLAQARGNVPNTATLQGTASRGVLPAESPAAEAVASELVGAIERNGRAPRVFGGDDDTPFWPRQELITVSAPTKD